MINDLRAQINEVLLAQPLIQPQDAPIRTATEVSITQSEIRDNAIAYFSRLQRELFDPIVKRVLYILQKKGIMEPLIVDGKEVSIKYKTPLTASKGQINVQTFMQLYGILAQLYTPGAAINLVQATKLPGWLGQQLGAELDLLKDEGQINALLKEAQELARNAIEQQQRGPAEPGPSEPLPATSLFG